MPSLLSHPSLLAHTIYQSLSFDAALIEKGFALSGTSATRGEMRDSQGRSGDLAEKWTGVSEVILGRKEWFNAWLAGEKKCESVLCFVHGWV
jgi:RAD50-interacting protein 1